MKSNCDRQQDLYSSLLEQLVSSEHVYRKVDVLLPVDELVKPLEELYAKTGKPGEPISRGFKCLLLQYWEDLSDRQLERYLRENLAAKWFCGYRLQERTPDHSYFGKLRRRIGGDF